MSARLSSLAKLWIVKSASTGVVQSVPVIREHHDLSEREKPMLNCLRPKTKKYSDGYPGDAEPTFPLSEREKRDIRTKVRWSCEQCETTFKDHEKTCGSCGHAKCDSCPRMPPPKTPKEQDAAAIKSLEERMKNLDVSPQASAA